MGQPKKPASLKGKSALSLAEREALDLKEQEMVGAKTRVNRTPKTLDAYGKTYYRTLIKDLSASNILGNLDIPILTATADCLSKMQQADEILEKEGIIFYQMDKLGNDIPKEHPMVKTKLAYLTQFRSLTMQLGLSPAARAALSEIKLAQETPTSDPVKNILNKLK